MIYIVAYSYTQSLINVYDWDLYISDAFLETQSLYNCKINSVSKVQF